MDIFNSIHIFLLSNIRPEEHKRDCLKQSLEVKLLGVGSNFSIGSSFVSNVANN